MAQPIVQSFVVDTAESEQNLKELNVQINATSTAIDSTAQSFDNVAAAENQVGASSKSLKAQLRDLQAQLAKTEPDSAKYRELAAAAGELKDKIQDASQAVGTQAGGAFEKVGGSLGLVTSRIANLDFAGAAEGAKLLAKNITEIKPGDIANGVKSIGSAFASIGKALLTNPIFLIGAAIAAAITYSEELFALVDGISSADQERLAAQEASAKASKEQLDAISAQENILRLAGKSEREILNIKIAAAQQAILDQKAVIATLEIQRQQQIDAAKRNADITKGILQFLTVPLQLLLGAVDYIILGLNKVGVISDETFASIGSLRENLNESITGLLFDPEEVAKEGDKSIEEAKKVLQGLENTQAGFQLSIKQMNQKAADDKAAAVQKEKDAAIKAQQEVSDLLEQLYAENVAEFEAAEKAKTDAQLKALEDRRKATEQYYNLLADLQDAQYQETLTASEKEELAITQKYEKLFAAADVAGISTVELQKKLAAELLAIQQKGASDESNTIVNKIDVAIKWAEKGLGALTALTDAVFANRMAKVKKGGAEEEALAKKQFKAQKALQLAGATIDAAKAINASLASAPVAVGPVPNPAGIASLALATVTGAAGIAKIAATKFESPGSPSTTTTPSIGGGGGAESTPAQFNPLAGMNLGERPEQLTPKAYVLAGDVASQQEVRQKVEDLSRIG